MKHNYEVVELSISDLEWFVETAAVQMLTEELQRPELVNIENLYKLADIGMNSRTAFIVKKDDVNIGALGAIVVPNLYNPDFKTLAELFWYVLPEYRKTRAGLLLLNAFDARAKEIADDATMSLLPSSDVASKSLERKGFKLSEFGFRKTYGEIEWQF